MINVRTWDLSETVDTKNIKDAGVVTATITIPTDITEALKVSIMEQVKLMSDLSKRDLEILEDCIESEVVPKALEIHVLPDNLDIKDSVMDDIISRLNEENDVTSFKMSTYVYGMTSLYHQHCDHRSGDDVYERLLLSR